MATSNSQASKLMYAASAVLLAGAAVMYSVAKSGLIGTPPASSSFDMALVIDAATAAARDTTRAEVGMHFRGIEQRLDAIQASVANIPSMQRQVHDLENRVDDMTKKPTGRIWEAIEELKARVEAMKSGIN